MNSSPTEILQRRRYVNLRDKGLTPIEAVAELGFTEHIENVAKQFEKRYVEFQKKYKASANKGLMNLASCQQPDANDVNLNQDNSDEVVQDDREYSDPMEYLMDLMNDGDAPLDVRMKIAFNLMPYKHSRKSTQKPLGKKDQQKEEAEKVSKGVFSTSKPPLTAVK